MGFFGEFVFVSVRGNGLRSRGLEGGGREGRG